MKNIIGYPNIVLITCQVLVLLEIRLSEGLKCLSCRSADMKSCFKTTTTCGYNEQCYLEKVVDSQYTTTFNAGCRRKDACPRGPSLLNLIGRRELPVSNLKRGLWNWTVCSECCNTTNKALPCNADLCNQGKLSAQFKFQRAALYKNVQAVTNTTEEDSAFGMFVQKAAELQQRCLSVKSDIVFLLDSSSSIGNNLFEHTLKTFAVDFISNPDMLVGPEYNQIGLVSFTGHEQKITSLNRYHDKTTMSQAVLNNFHFEAGSTETHEALRLVKNFIFTPLFGDRPDAENILVIITDGGSHFPPETLKEAKKLKDAGVRIYAIGVGDYNTLNHLSEINGVSSGIFATYGLYPYNPRAIQELLWKSICQNSTTRFGDSHWQHHTTKHSTSTRRVTSRLTSPTVRTSIPTTQRTTPIPTTPSRISVPTAKTRTSASVTPTRISVPTAKTRTSVSVTPTRISVPTFPVRISIPTSPNRVTVQTLSPTLPTRLSVPTSQIRISVPTAKTQTPVVVVTQTFPISVPSQTNKPTSCLDHPFCIASGISICSGGYANWARGSCPNLCGFCKATTPSSPKPTTISSTRKPARLTTNTSQRTKTSLTTRKQTTITSIAPNKSQTSSFTGKQTKIRTTLSTTTQPRRSYTPQQTTISTQTSSKKMCRDNSNCSVYGPTICGRFVSFAKTHCSAYCGYCTPPLTTALPNSAKTNSPTTRTTTMTPLTTKAHTKSTKAILTTSTTKATTTSTTKAAMTSTTKSATTSTTTKSATTSTTTKSATTSTTTKAATTSTTTKAPTTSTTTKAPTTSTTTKAPTTSTTTKASTISVTTKAPRPAATTKTSKAVVTTSPKPSTTAAATTKKLITGLSFDWKTIHIPG